MNEFESDWISLSQSQSEVRVFLKVSETRKQSVWIQDGSVWIQHGRVQDGCHYQVKWEWMSLSQIELVWVRVRVKSECFWRNLREDNKVSESKMAVSESNMAEFRMAAIIKLSQNEWVKIFFVENGWIEDGCHHQVESDWMHLSQIELVYVRVLCNIAESKMAEF